MSRQTQIFLGGLTGVAIFAIVAFTAFSVVREQRSTSTSCPADHVMIKAALGWACIPGRPVSW